MKNILEYDNWNKNGQKHISIYIFRSRNSIFTLFCILRSWNYVFTLVFIFDKATNMGFHGNQTVNMVLILLIKNDIPNRTNGTFLDSSKYDYSILNKKLV